MNLNIANTIGSMEDQGFADIHTNLQTSLEELNTICIAMEDVQITEEGLRDAFKGIANVYKTISTNFSNLVGGARKKYKTEFDVWYKKNKSTIAKVNGLNPETLGDIMVDFPTGMTKSYVETLSMINSFFETFTTNSQLKYISSTIDTIISSISKESNAHEQSVAVANKTIAGTSKKTATVHKALIDSFDLSMVANKQKPFDQLFPGKTDLESTISYLAKINPMVATDTQMLKACTDIEQSLDLCVEYIEDRIEGKTEGEYVPSKEFIKTLASFIGSIDKMFVMYGDTVIRTLAIQHNITFVYKTLAAESKG